MVTQGGPPLPLLQAEEITYTDVQRLRRDRCIASEPAIIQPGFRQRLGLIPTVALGAGLAWALRR